MADKNSLAAAIALNDAEDAKAAAEAAQAPVVTQATPEPEAYDLLRKEEVIKLVDAKTRLVTKYRLVDIFGSDRDEYNTFTSKKLTVSDGKASGVTDTIGIQAKLLSLAILKENEEARAFSMAEIQAWPSSIQTAIFKKAERICGLDKEAEERAKNS